MTHLFDHLPRDPYRPVTTADGWTIRAAQPEDLARLVELGASARHRTPLTRSQLVWMHGESLEGIAVAHRIPSERLDAAVGVRTFDARRGMTRDLRVGVRTLELFHPAAEQVEAPPLLLRCAWALNGLMEPLATIVSTPRIETFRLGRRIGVPGHALGREVVRTEVALRFDESTVPDRFPSHAETGSAFPGTVGDLQDRVLPEQAFAIVRDPAWYQWRFHPASGHRYDLAWVPGSNGTVRAAGAGRVGHWGSSDPTYWVEEFSCEPFDYDAGLSLLRFFLEAAQVHACPTVDFLLPEWWPWSTHLQWNGARVVELGRFTTAESRDRRLDTTSLRDHWWYGLADTLPLG